LSTKKKDVLWTTTKEIADNGIDDDKTDISMTFMDGIFLGILPKKI
jgi:hypothetical protein